MPKFRLKGYYRILAVVLLLVFLLNIQYFESVKTYARYAMNPVFKTAFGLGGRIRSLFDRDPEKSALVEKNEELVREITGLVSENAKMKTLEEENEALRKYMGFKEKSGYELLLANVIIENYNNTAFSEMIIDKGSLDGIREGYLAVDSEGMAVGKITEVKENISKIQLANSEKCKLAATLQNESRTSGITYGELGLTIAMDYIPLTAEVKTGDLAVTSGLEPNIPRGIVIGRVVKVEKSNNELWQKAVIEPLSNYNNIFIASIIIGEAS